MIKFFKKIFSAKGGPIWIILFILFGWFFLIPKFRKVGQSVADSINENERKEEFETELSELASTGQLPTYQNESFYKGKADQLHSAFKGWGTDEQAVYNVFKAMNVDADIVALKKAFGIRDGMTLDSYIVSELDQVDRWNLNLILKNRGLSQRY